MENLLKQKVFETLADVFGVYGAYSAQPVADVLGLLVAGTMLARAYRRYPPSRTGSDPAPVG